MGIVCVGVCSDRSWTGVYVRLSCFVDILEKHIGLDTATFTCSLGVYACTCVCHLERKKGNSEYTWLMKQTRYNFHVLSR